MRSIFSLTILSFVHIFSFGQVKKNKAERGHADIVIDRQKFSHLLTGESLLRKPIPPQALSAGINSIPLGGSKNPFTSSGNGRHYLTAHTALKTVTLFRRGGDGDSSGLPGQNRFKLFYDYDKTGGADSAWTIGKGPMWTEVPFLNHPNYIVDLTDYGARYPQGLLINPPGNTNPDSLVAFGLTPFLSGSNGEGWGGMGVSWKKLGQNQPAKTLYMESGATKHRLAYSLVQRPGGEIFAVAPELIPESQPYSYLFSDKIIVYKFNYNAASNTVDTSIQHISFPNNVSNPLYATEVWDAVIDFDPGGQIGYIGFGGYNFEFDTARTYMPFVSKTSDGGQTWSQFQMLNINPPSSQMSQGILELRNQMLGDYVHFGVDTVYAVPPNSPFSHKVNYLVKNLDIAVDSLGKAHLLTQFCVGNFQDTMTHSNFISYYPLFKTWFVDIVFDGNTAEAKFKFLAKGESVWGKWGSLPSITSDIISEDNRPQISKSENGKNIAFFWHDTDLAKNPPAFYYYPNQFPDLYMRVIQLSNSGNYFISPAPINVTVGTEKEGYFSFGTVSPILMPIDSGYRVLAASAEPGLFMNTTADWPTSHYFLRGVSIKSDTSLLQPCTFSIISSLQKETVGQQVSSNIQIIPNPAFDNFSLVFDGKHSGPVSLKLYNQLGKEILYQQVQGRVGKNVQKIMLPAVSPGIYFLKVNIDGIFSTHILQVQ